MEKQQDNDYRRLKVGDKTTLGSIKHIYGLSESFIVFLNDKDDCKVFSERNDAVYNKALATSLEIGASSFKKLNKVRLSDVNDHISSCLSSALKDGVTVDEIDNLFKPAITFINSLPKTKQVIARGPSPQHIVYLNEFNHIGWECKELPKHIHSELFELEQLRQQCNSLLPKILRTTPALSIGASVSSILRSNQSDNLKVNVEAAKEATESRIREYNYSKYFFFILFIGLTFTCGINYLAFCSYSEISLAISGGVLGAFLSGIQRTRVAMLSIYESTPSIIVQALQRIIVGGIAGFIVFASSEADFAFGFIRNNNYMIFVATTAAGFIERWVPDFLSSLANSKL